MLMVALFRHTCGSIAKYYPQAFAQRQIISANLKPSVGFLIEIQAATNLFLSVILKPGSFRNISTILAKFPAKRRNILS
jgi:hypothetical protein